MFKKKSNKRKITKNIAKSRDTLPDQSFAFNHRNVVLDPKKSLLTKNKKPTI